jgi:rhodanese-related sulfurtransferase
MMANDWPSPSQEKPMSKSIMNDVADAKSAVPSISPEELIKVLGQDNVLVVDVRDAPELAGTGKVKGALNVSRGMLEFRADETTKFHDPLFSKDKMIVTYCSSGGRAALAAKALLDLGYRDVRRLGTISDWVDAGGETEQP